VCFDGDEGFLVAPTYWREGLPSGSILAGPAVIEEYGATVPLHPGFTATVDHLGNLVVTRSRAASDVVTGAEL
jgi:N-methylhydantoinase A